MANITVDISDMKLSANAEDVIVTYALGSCIAVMAYDPVVRVGGMIHFMLPFSKTAPDKAESRPAMFCDSGVPVLFESLYRLGAKKENIIVKVAGGGKLWEDSGTFDIGKRNYTALRKLFWINNVIIASEDVGGNKSRTARLYLNDGRVTVTSKGVEAEL
jgi:chemotaxis protein CheD